jgi:integrase
VRRVKPLLKKHLEVIFFSHLHGLQGVRDRALLLLGFLGGFRRSELTNLEVEDVSFSNSGMIVRLNRSKTDQQGEGRDVPIPKLDSHLCAVKAVKEWLEASGISHGAIFREVDRLGIVGASKLTSGMVARTIKKYIKKIGLDPSNYSGHSLRAGLVTSAAIAGAAEWQIRKQTGHKSNEMVSRYIRQSEMFSDNVATMIATFSANK